MIVSSGKAAAPTISLSNQTVSAIATNATATATYEVASNGDVYAIINGHSSVLESWISDPSKAANYDVEAVLSSGTSPPGDSALNTWLAASGTPDWYLQNAAKDNSTISCVLTVKIREHASGTVKATATITISAESDSLA